jgi:hypothetical protein
MKGNEIDDVLAGDDRIEPSPAFLASVMRAVEREAASLPPLTFPWRRALPLLAAAIVAVARAIAVLGNPSAMAQLQTELGTVAGLAIGLELHWIALACTATILALVLSSRLVQGPHHA